MSHLGKTLLIANPVSQNGKGALAAARASALLKAALGQNAFEIKLTEHACHATELALHSQHFDTVVALGGDGVVHEVVNGLMQLAPQIRPRLGVLPVGSGNDYARTLGMSFALDRAVNQLLTSRPRMVDVGRCNEVYFMETLSFGLDAAIAADTVERRKRTGSTGTMLYVASGIEQLLHHLRDYRFEAHLEDGTVVLGSAFLMAIQVGPTYGGGFLICPQAQVDDGFFDICIARPPLSIPRATLVFLLAKNGLHTHFKQVEFHRASSIKICFEQQPPAQVDGELLQADSFDISLMHQALEVLVPA